MGLTTNFNQAPYFDDFSANANYYRILFQPGSAVQARELTQSQTILQDQISKFGTNLFTEGTIVSGTALSFDSKLNYVKLLDQYTNTSVLNVSSLENYIVQNPNGLNAIVLDTLPGYQANFNANNAANSVLNTIYVKYLNTANTASGPQQIFAPDDILSVIDSNTNITIAQVQVANAATVPVGLGYSATVADGVIYQKGFFVRVAPQTVIVSNYNTAPDGVSLGFFTQEQIITPEIDPSLYDNALGSDNYSAPGANRLKLIPQLTVVSSNLSQSNIQFFSICDFIGGAPAIINTNTQYASLEAEIAKSRFEETGNYVITPFPVTVKSQSATLNTHVNYVNCQVGAGVGYVQGYRVEFVNNVRVPVRRGIDTVTINTDIVSVASGNYILVDEYAGDFTSNELVQVELHSVAHTALTSGTFISTARSSSTVIGYANIKIVDYDTGSANTPTGTYRMYLFNISMNPGYNFNQVKSVIYWNGSSVLGICDTILNNGNCVPNDTSLTTCVYAAGPAAIQQYANQTFTYRSRIASSTMSTSGNLTVTTTDTIPYQGILSSTEEEDLLFITQSNLLSTNKTGTVSNTAANVLTGTSTTFASDYQNGDWIYINSAATRISQVINNTSMQLSTNLTGTVSGATHQKIFPAGSVISIVNNPTRVVTATSTTLTLSMNESFTSAVGVTAYFNAVRSNTQPIQKIINYNSFVKIDTSNNINTNLGPWCLGLPDVANLVAVYVGSNHTYSNTGTNFANNFILNTGQGDQSYRLASISVNPQNPITLASNSTLTIVIDNFTVNESAGKGFFDINSYPIDDSNTSNTSAIQTSEIPVYTDSRGIKYDLRDSVDFRPVCINTAATTSVLTSANINPSSTVTFNTSGNYLVATDSTFQSTVTYYLGRTDILSLTPSGKLQIQEGTANVNPVAPIAQPGAMTLAIINVPPYPSLASDEAALYGRYDYAITQVPQQNRRYTMQDIGAIDQRVSDLEYYTSLSLLESSANNLLISNTTSSTPRFKNGFLVDPFNDFTVSDTQDPTFNIAIDPSLSVIRPAFNVNTYDLQYIPNQIISGNLNLGSNNSQQTGDIASISYDQVTYIQQPYASQYRNCIQSNLYSWQGSMVLLPSADTAVDYTSNPPVVANIDLAQNWIDLANAWGTVWNSWNDVSSSTTAQSSTSSVTSNNQNVSVTLNSNTTTYTTQTTQARTGLQVAVSTSNTAYDLGSYITSLGVSPYVRPKVIGIWCYGMKPNTEVYPFFQDEAVSQYCFIPTEQDPYGTLTIGGPFYTSNTGTVFLGFYIPADTFNVGTITCKVVDVPDLTTGSNDITTIAQGQYVAQSISATTQDVIVNTRQATIATQDVAETRVLTSQSSTTSVSPVVSVTGDIQQAINYNTANNVTNIGAVNGVVQPHQSSAGDPIGQTFFINEIQQNQTSVDGVFVTSIDIFFQSKDPNLPVELQIRECVNGFPTPKIIPFGDVIVQSANVNVSSDGTAATTFTFSSPVYLESQTQYFICVIPSGGSPNYSVWSGVIGQTDVASGTSIFTLSSIGNLFVSSTNLTWTPYQNEAMKFTLRRADFSVSSNGIIGLENKDYEFISYSNSYSSFTLGETVYAGNTVNNNAVLTVSSPSGTFTVGQTLSQNNGTTVTATGIITSATSTTIKASNCNGTFNTSTNVYSGGATTVVTAANQKVVVTNGQNTISVPDTTVYSNNQFVYVTSSDYKTTIYGQITSIFTGNSTLRLSNNVPFTTNTALIGFINGGTTPLSATVQQITTNNQIILANSTSNSTFNFVGQNNMPLFGLTSKAMAFMSNCYDVLIDNLNISIQTLVPTTTYLYTQYKGVSNSYVADTAFTVLPYNFNNEFLDKERVLMSRSNEQVYNGGNKSILVQAVCVSANSKISPVIDDIKMGSLITNNLIVPEAQLDGYVLQTNNNILTAGTLIQQGSNTATICQANSTMITIYNLSGSFNGTANVYSVAANTNQSIVTGISAYGEEISSPFSPSRYVSKKVTLATGQDAEDMIVYLAAYRPIGTDVVVYCKLQNAQDVTSYYSAPWTRMIIDPSSKNLYSTLSNVQDYVELQYNLPESEVIQESVTTSNTSANITIAASSFNSDVAVGAYAYLLNNTTNAFNITTITGINGTTITLANDPSFNTSNAEFGVVPGLTALNSAFKFMTNNGVVRYVQNSNIFDTYLQFAIKIVPVSNTPNIYPTVQDMRAIALQV